MRRRFALLWTMVVLGAAMALPATTAAGSQYVWETRDNTCTNSGGNYGYGKSVLTIRQYEYGMSGTTRFRQSAKLQEKHGSTWRTIDSSGWYYSNSFANTSGSTYFQHKFVGNWGSSHQSYYGRLQVTTQWLNHSGSIIAAQKINGYSC